MNRRYRLPVDVEPFTEPRWARVERDMFAQLDDLPFVERANLPPRGLIYAAALVVAVGVAVFVFVHGVVRSPVMSDPVRLATRESASRFSIGESSVVAAADSLVLVRGDDERGVNVMVDHGRIDCEVAPRRGRPPFVVDAGEVRVRVVGTGFSVEHDAKRTAVRVSHGVVEVVMRGVLTTLHDGDRWQDGVSMLAASAPDRSASSMSEPGMSEPGMSEPGMSAPGMSAATDFLAPDARSADVPSEVEPEVESPEAPKVRREGRPPEAAVGARMSETTANPAPPSKATTTSPMQPWPDDSAAKPAAPASAGEAEFNAAAEMERKHPQGAALIYRRIAGSDSEWAPNALFALAHLESQRGHRAAASDLLRAYLTHYPRGINADDARTLLRQLQ